MDKSVLERPFDKSLIKSRKSAFGRVSYVEGAEYVRRLNEIFDCNWNFEVIEHRIEGSEVLVVGRLTAGGVIKSAFGGSQITLSKEGGRRISVADDFKSAATDSLKKCCSLFGIGLHLYSNGVSSKSEKSSNGRSRSKGANNGGSRPGSNNGNGSNGANGNRLTQKQLSAIWNLARKANYSSDEIKSRSIELFKAAPEYLTKAQASEIIGDLMNELGDDAAS